MTTLTGKAERFLELHRAGRRCSAQPVGRRVGPAAGVARLRGAGHDQRRVRRHPRPARRRGDPGRGPRPRRRHRGRRRRPGLGRPRERLRRRPRRRGGDDDLAVRRRPGRVLDRGLHRPTTTPIYDLGLAAERVAAAAEAAHGGAGARSCSPPGPRTTSTAGPTWPTPSPGCRRYQEAGADVLFAPGCTTPMTSARWSCPSTGPSTSSPFPAARPWPSWPPLGVAPHLGGRGVRLRRPRRCGGGGPGAAGRGHLRLVAGDRRLPQGHHRRIPLRRRRPSHRSAPGSGVITPDVGAGSRPNPRRRPGSRRMGMEPHVAPLRRSPPRRRRPEAGARWPGRPRRVRPCVPRAKTRAGDTFSLARQQERTRLGRSVGRSSVGPARESR